MPFTARDVIGSADFLNETSPNFNETSPNSNIVVEASPITSSGHRCAIGQIEVNTSRADSGTPGEYQPYYVQFSD